MTAEPTTTAPAKPRSRRFWTPRKRDWFLRIGTLVSFLGLWQWYGNTVNKVLLATPTAIAYAVWELFVKKNEILPAAWTTLSALLLGFTLSAVFGVVIGLAMGRIRLIQRMLDPYVSFFYAVPSIVFVPLVLAWVGLGIQLRVVLAVMAAVFPVIINTMVGVRQVPAEYTEVGSTFCASSGQTMRTIVLPYALPFIFVGLRQAMLQSFVMVVVAEMLVAITGLGGLMIVYSNFFKTARLFVPLLLIMALSMLLTTLLRRLGERLAPWGKADQ